MSQAAVSTTSAPGAASPTPVGGARPWWRAVAEALLDVRAVMAVAAALILATLVWCLRQPYPVLLAYADTPTHLNLARRMIDDLHAGLGQLGAYWLPLAHVIELPFIWNDTLWRTGLAGAFPSMICYLISVWCLYRLTALATGERVPAVIASLAFAANPNVLYLHVTAMFEPCIIASILVATYLLARWLTTGSLGLLVAAGIAVSVTTISRYEAWGFAIASALVVALGLWQQGCHGQRWRDRLLLYLLPAWYLMALWLVWNLALNGDPFYFLHPSFNTGLGENRLAVLTKHSPLHATAYVTYAVADNAGPLLLGLGALGLWRFAVNMGAHARGLWLYLLAAPAAFDVFYLWFKGTPPILAPQLFPYTSGNIRYGLVSLPLLCVLLGYLARRPTLGVLQAGPRARILRAGITVLWPLVQATLLAAAIAQPILLTQRHFVVSYQEPNTSAYRADQEQRMAVARWLGAHYDRGLILMSTFKGADRIILNSGLPDRDFVHEGSQDTWHCALLRPQRWVRWIVLFKRGDGAVQLLHTRAVAGGQYFTRIDGAGGAYYWVFRRNDRPWRPPHAGTCE
jgi:hypothetical protein